MFSCRNGFGLVVFSWFAMCCCSRAGATISSTTGGGVAPVGEIGGVAIANFDAEAGRHEQDRAQTVLASLVCGSGEPRLRQPVELA